MKAARSRWFLNRRPSKTEARFKSAHIDAIAFHACAKQRVFALQIRCDLVKEIDIGAADINAVTRRRVGPSAHAA